MDTSTLRKTASDLIYLSSGHAMTLDAYLHRGKYIASLFQKRGIPVHLMEKPTNCKSSDFSFTMSELGANITPDLHMELCKAGVAATIVGKEGELAIVNIRSIHSGSQLIK